MTVKELKEHLELIPDDVEVGMDNIEYNGTKFYSFRKIIYDISDYKIIFKQ